MYMNQMLNKYGISTSLEQRVGLEFIDFDRTNSYLDDKTETAS